MKKTELSRRALRSEIIKVISEACGCAGGGDDLPMPHAGEASPLSSPTVEVEGLSKEEALDLVSIIAARTTCPVTREALEDVVDDLEPEDMRGDEGERVIDAMGMDQDSAFGAGYTLGQDERGSFDYTGDMSELTPEQAFELGSRAGVMGLQERKSLSKHEVRRLLRSIAQQR